MRLANSFIKVKHFLKNIDDKGIVCTFFLKQYRLGRVCVIEIGLTLLLLISCFLNMTTVIIVYNN